MSNKTPIIFSIILISIAIFCLVIFLVSYLCGGKFGTMHFGSKNSKVILDKTFELSQINNIDIKQDAGNIILKNAQNDDIQVVVYGENDNDASYELKDGNLVVNYKQMNRFRFFNFGSIKNDIIVYIPSSYSNIIKIKNNLGNCEITDLENVTLDIDCDAGNVETGKIKNANIKCDLGNVEIKEILNKCDIRVDAGNVDITKIDIKEDSKIKVDLGNVNINETNNIYINAKADLGKVNINGNNRNSDITLEIDCDCGNIEVGK